MPERNVQEDDQVDLLAHEAEQVVREHQLHVEEDDDAEYVDGADERESSLLGLEAEAVLDAAHVVGTDGGATNSGRDHIIK